MLQNSMYQGHLPMNPALFGTITMLSAKNIVGLQDERTRKWHRAEVGEVAFGELSGSDGRGPGAVWLEQVSQQHRANFELWHIEDEARSPGTSDAQLAEVKRRIDKTNQRRNDLAERLDNSLLAWLKERDLPKNEAPLHSESPGLMIDRLSILSLKIYHTAEEAERLDAPEGHAARNRERLSILEEQRADLAECLDALWGETLAGTRRFKLYRQLKMYNDPSLNPAIYGKDASKNPQ